MTASLAITLPELYTEQHDAFFNPALYSVCEASPKAGKTLGAIVWLSERLLSDPRHNLNWWWVAPVYKQAEIGYRRAKIMLKDLCTRSNDTDMRLYFENGKRMEFRSGEKPDNLYGEDVADAVVDEFTRIREESWTALQTTMTATNGSIRLIGNVKGRGNWGYRLARLAQQGGQGLSYHKITADEAMRAGTYTRERLEFIRSQMPEQVFRELYYCEPSDDGGNPFGIKAIESCLRPMSEKEPVCYGVDLAKSVDYTVFIGLDADGAVCRYDRWNRRSWDETGRRLASEIGNRPALVDSTGVGDPVVERLQRDLPSVEGFKFTQGSKQQIMEGLAVAIQQGTVGFPDGPIKQELDTFEYELTRTSVRYAAPEGLHDDCVCALALANHHLRLWQGGAGVATIGAVTRPSITDRDYHDRVAADLRAEREERAMAFARGGDDDL